MRKYILIAIILLIGGASLVYMQVNKNLKLENQPVEEINRNGLDRFHKVNDEDGFHTPNDISEYKMEVSDELVKEIELEEIHHQTIEPNYEHWEEVTYDDFKTPVTENDIYENFGEHLTDFPQPKFNDKNEKAEAIYNWVIEVENIYLKILGYEGKAGTPEQKEQIRTWLLDIYTEELVNIRMDDFHDVEGGYRFVSIGRPILYQPKQIIKPLSFNLVENSENDYVFQAQLHVLKNSIILITYELEVEENYWKIRSLEYQYLGQAS